MSIPTIQQLEQQQRDAHYAFSKKMSDLNDEAVELQNRLQEIQAEAQQIQQQHVIDDAKWDAQIELLKALEAKP